MMHECRETLAPSEVAERTALTRGAVSKWMGKVKEKGLVVRAKSKTDRRYQEVKLTPKAKRLVPKLTKVASANQVPEIPTD